MRGEHELQRDPALELLRRDALEPRERIVERFPRHALVELVRTEPAHAMVLLGDVCELEVEGEGAQHARLPLERQRLDGFLDLLVRRAGARRARERAHPLDVLEQRLALLLDEDAPEQVAEQADVTAERCIGGFHVSSLGLGLPQNRTIGSSFRQARASVDA